MTNPTEYRRAILSYLKDSYGIADAEIHKSPGGGHRKVRFTYSDKLHTLTIHDHTNNIGGQALNMKLQDIRRTLGPPPSIPAIVATKQVRQSMPLPQPETPYVNQLLQEIPVAMETSITDNQLPVEIDPSHRPLDNNKPVNRSYNGTCALNTPPSSNNARLRFSVPLELFLAFGYDGGCTITRLDEETFTIKPRHGFKTPRFFLEPVSGHYEMISEKIITKTPDLIPWGSSPVEYQLVDNLIMAHCPVATRRISKAKGGRRSKAAVMSDIANLGAGVMDPARSTNFAVKRGTELQQLSNQSIDEAAMKAVLTTIKRIEDAIPYRLVKLAEGGWAWRAPTIRLE